MTKRFFIISCVLCLVGFSTVAQSIPLNGLSLRLIPKFKEADDNGPKTVVISKNSRSLKLSWYSLVKDLDEEAYYPTYKIKAKKGMIETDGLDMKTGFFQPNLWGIGYIRSDTVLALWMDSEYLNLKGRQKRQFNVGLLNNHKNLVKQAPNKLFEQLNYFENLYGQYVRNGTVRTDVKISKRQQKQLKKFVANFSMVQLVAKTKFSLVVNGKKIAHPGKIIGNEYYHLMVLDDPSNPLVVNFKLFPDKVPSVFKSVFKDFKTSFEFQVTQMSY